MQGIDEGYACAGAEQRAKLAKLSVRDKVLVPVYSQKEES